MVWTQSHQQKNRNEICSVDTTRRPSLFSTNLVKSTFVCGVCRRSRQNYNYGEWCAHCERYDVVDFDRTFFHSHFVLVFEGRDLIACDKGGTSDPYCVVTFGSVQKKTKTIKKTVSPRWESGDPDTWTFEL